MYNHIPGNGVIARKDLLVETIKYFGVLNFPYHVSSYMQKYHKKPHCIQSATFAPRAYRLGGNLN